MRTLINCGFFDYIVYFKPQQKPNTEPVVNDEGKKIYQLEQRADTITFFTENGRDDYGNVTGYQKQTLRASEILALAERIKEIESTPIADGQLGLDEDLPF